MSNISEKLISLILKAGDMMVDADLKISDGAITEKFGDIANLVTEYDVAIQKYLIDEIKAFIPNACFIAEEKENDPTVLESEYCFIIDPIDGTTNFIHSYRHSCISLALFSRGQAVFAAIYDPYLKEMFSAEAGKGAYLNGKRMSVSQRDGAHSVVAYGTSPYCKAALGEKTFALCEKLFMSCIDVRRCGSAALDLAYLAAGRNDMFFELMLSPWDIAAGYLLIKEAGGIITDNNGNEIDFSKPCPVIAANKVAYQFLLDTVKNI